MIEIGQGGQKKAGKMTVTAAVMQQVVLQKKQAKSTLERAERNPVAGPEEPAPIDQEAHLKRGSKDTNDQEVGLKYSGTGIVDTAGIAQ